MSKKPQILIVEDNAINRKVMLKFFEEIPVEVLEATDGYDALRKVQSEDIDMIFMDIFMPGMDGYQTTEKIRELGGKLSSIPIIAVTANERGSNDGKAKQVGMDEVLGKPLLKEDIKHLIKHYILHEEEQSTTNSRVFDRQAFEYLYEEDYLRKEIVKTVLEDEKRDIQEVEAAFNSKDPDVIYQKIHYLKGTFTYLKAARILEITQQILNLCKDEKVDEALELRDMFVVEFDMFIDELVQYFKTL